MLWSLEKNEKKSTIVGTAHFFRYSYRRTFTRLVRDASVVLLEGPLDKESMDRVAQYGLNGADTPSVLKAINPEVVRKINRHLSRSAHQPTGPTTGLAMVRPSNPSFLELYADGVRPWMALFSTWSAFLRTRGWKTSMDMEAYTVATKLGKEVHFLETIEEQLAALDGVPFERIVAFFNAFDEWGRHSERHLSLFLTGRYQEMISSTTTFPTRCPSIVDERDPVLFERMKPWVEQGGAVAFVGMSHVYGLRGMFERDGYIVRQEAP